MPQETELQIDDGTYAASLEMQCETCQDHPYLERVSKEVTTTGEIEVTEYTFACPNQGCSTSVVVRVPHLVAV
jgi:hypothetical protein